MKQFFTILTLIFSAYALPLMAQCPPPGFPLPGDGCQDAPILCETLDGYCSTLGNNNVTQPFPGCGGSVLNNDEWFAFYAGSTTITIVITPTNCTAAPPNQGIQAAIYQGCGGPTMATQCNCTTAPVTMTSTNYIIGEIYYIVIDGCGGDICDYSVEVTSGNTQGNAPDNPGPISGDQQVCQDDISTYSVAPVQGATIYNWALTPPIGIVSGNGPTVDVVWATPGVANLCLDVANACFPNGNQVCYNVTVNANPNANISPAPMITCVVDEVMLNGAGSSTGGNISYQWTGPGITSGGNTLTPTVNQGGTYTLLVTNTTTGCEAETMITVSEDTALPIANAGPPLTLNCAVPQFPLQGFGSSSGPPGFSYQWTTNDGNIVSGAGSQNPIVNAPGTYTITVTNLQNGCTSEASTVVTVDADTPIADAGVDVVIGCGSNTVIIDGSNSTDGPSYTYVWMTNDGNIVSGGNTDMPTVDQSGTYFLTIFNGSNGCVDMDTVMVTIDNTTPTVDIENPTEISCLDPQILIDATGSSDNGNYTYVWTTSDGNIVSGGSTLEPEVDQAGTYTLTITNEDNGCVDDASITVDGDILTPDVVIEAPDNLSCTDPQVVLDASNSDSGPEYTYVWTTPDGNIISGGNTATPTVGAAGTYELTIINTNNNCETTESVLVDVDADQPVINLDPVDELNCTLTEFQLNAAITGGQNLSFSWSTPDGNFVSGTNTLQPVIDAAGTYEITVINDDNGCEEISSVVVTEDALIPQTDAGPDGELTCAVLDIDLDGSNSDGGPNITYQWTTPDGNIVSGANTTIANIDGPGTYILETINSANTCESSDTVVITENVSIIDAQIVPPILMGCANPIINLDGSGSSIGGSVTYTWTTSDGSIVSGDDTPVLEISGPGTYDLLVYDVSNDCFDATQTTVIQDLTEPIADAGIDGLITCTVTEVELQGSASGNTANFIYQWTTLDGNIASGNNTLNPTVDLEGTYTLTVTDIVNQCTTTSTTTVTQDADVPISDIVSSNPFDCNFSSVTLDGSGSTQGPNLVYTWSTPDGNIVSNPDDLSAIVDQAGAYTLLINDTVSFCMSSSTFQVMPDTASPVIGIAAPEVLDCVTPSVVLASDAGGLPDIDITWNTADGNIVADGTTFNPTVDQTGTYSLTITNNENGCVSTSDVDVTGDFDLPIVDAGPADIVNCFNPEISLNGSGDAGGDMIEYQWSTVDGNIVSDDTTPNPVIDAGGTYQLLIINLENGCENTADVTIAQDQLDPTVDPGLPGLLNCFSPEIDLDGTGSSAGAEFEYQWTTLDGNILAGADTQTPSVDQIGTYTLLITNTVNGCESQSTVDVTEDFQVPAADAGGDGLLNCVITSTTLNGTGSMGAEFTYTWTTVDGNIVSGANTLNPEIDLEGTYQLVVFNTVNGCSSTSDVDVVLDADFPIVAAVGNDPITCEDASVQLDGSGTDVGANFTYQWTTLDGNIISGTTNLDPLVDQPGTYTLTVTNTDNECISTTNVMVAIDTIAPVAEAGLTDLLNCDILSLNLNGIGSSAGVNFEYLWTTLDGNILSGNDQVDPVVNEPGTYQILVTDNANGCQSTDNVVVTQDIEDPIAISAVNDILTCDLQSLFISGIGSSVGPEFTYDWSTGNGNILNGGNSLDPEVNQPGTYTLSIEDTSNGCTAETTVTVEQDVVAPTLLITTPALLTCKDLTVFVSATGSSSGANFTPDWTTINGNIVSGSNTLSIEVDQPGAYTLEIENDDNGCISSEDIVVGQDVDVPVVDAGVDFVLPCEDDITSLSATASGNSTNLSFEWTTLNGVIENNANSLDAGISSAGIYSLTVTDLDNGCENDDEVVVTEDNPSDPNLTVDQPICSDDFGILELFDVTDGTPPYMYSIDNGETFFTNSVFTNLEGGDYNIVVQDAIGCESGVVVASVIVPAPIEVAAETNIEILQGETYQINLQLNVNPADVDTVIWTPSLGLSCADCLNPIASPLITTNYQVEVVVAGECRTTEEVQIFVDERPSIFAPNIFSPDNDGNNDLFYLFGRLENILEIRNFVIMDRWGERVHVYRNFQPNDPGSGWDGTHRGQQMNPGVFVWFAEVVMIDGRIEFFEGDITIVR